MEWRTEQRRYLRTVPDVAFHVITAGLDIKAIVVDPSVDRELCEYRLREDAAGFLDGLPEWRRRCELLASDRALQSFTAPNLPPESSVSFAGFLLRSLHDAAGKQADDLELQKFTVHDVKDFDRIQDSVMMMVLADVVADDDFCDARLV
jgi:hypothetical protein